MGLPEIMLALAVFSISPFVIVFLLVDTGYYLAFFWFGPPLLTFAFSLTYLLAIAPRMLVKSIRARNLGRHGMAHSIYLLALAAYGVAFTLTVDRPGVAPFLLFLGFIPFQAAGVLAVTIATQEEQNPELRRFRIGLASLQLLCALPWPFVLMATLP
ncbi:MAG: hypothetical protein MUC90_07485 [Thermoplasmata archaeon]|jgi:hypothetical protein|nr:hypothetical protein [Thermoplasmata archaeon]